MAEPLRFDGRVVLVTGGGRGLGRAHCLELARRGARVVVNDLGSGMDGSGSDASVAHDVVAEIATGGGEAAANTDSVTDEQGVRNMIACALDTFGRIDAVVHNAGIVGFTPVEQMSLAEYRSVLAVHLEAGFLLAREAWSHMVRQTYGRLVFITSQAALSGLANLAHYGSAKSGLVGLNRVLALEGADHGIRSNCLGVTAMTRMMDDFFTSDDEHRPAALAETRAWWERHHRPDIVSPVVAYLAHEKCTLSGELLDTGVGHVSRQFLATTEGYFNPALSAEDVAEHLSQIVDEEGAHGAFQDASGFLEWRHDKLLAQAGPAVAP